MVVSKELANSQTLKKKRNFYNRLRAQSRAQWKLGFVEHDLRIAIKYGDPEEIEIQRQRFQYWSEQATLPNGHKSDSWG